MGLTVRGVKMKKKLFVKVIVFVLLAILLSASFFGCGDDRDVDIADYEGYNGSVYVVGENNTLNLGESELFDLRVTDTTVQREDEIIHRDDVATVTADNIAMHKSGKYLLWVVKSDNLYTYSRNIWGINLNEYKKLTINGLQFKTTIYLQEKSSFGEDFPVAVYNKNITSKTINITTPHLDPYQGTPGISIFTVVDGHKLYIGGTMGYATAIGNYSHAPNKGFKLLQSYYPIIARGSVTDAKGKHVAEDAEILEKLGFESNFYNVNSEQNEAEREKQWKIIKEKYYNDLSNPDYNREWAEIYDKYPVYNEAYDKIIAPRGKYHIQLSTGRIIKNAFTIV
jgi:hypothetical protein